MFVPFLAFFQWYSSYRFLVCKLSWTSNKNTPHALYLISRQIEQPPVWKVCLFYHLEIILWVMVSSNYSSTVMSNIYFEQWTVCIILSRNKSLSWWGNEWKQTKEYPCLVLSVFFYLCFIWFHWSLSQNYFLLATYFVRFINHTPRHKKLSFLMYWSSINIPSHIFLYIHICVGVGVHVCGCACEYVKAAFSIWLHSKKLGSFALV